MIVLKKNLWIIIVIGIIGICLVSGIIRICYSLPWYDEVFFADITHSLQVDNSLTLNMVLPPVEATIYGPVYFYTQKLIVSFLDFGMWQFRLLNFASGIGLIVTFLTIARRLNLSNVNICILIALISFDPRFTFNMTSGRMDLFALALFMGGWLIFINSDRRTFFLIIVSGIISSLSFLATPRLGFYFLVYILIFICEFSVRERKRTFFQYAVFGLSVLIPVLSWIYYSYGDLSNYFDFIFHNPDIGNHYGGSVFPLKYQIPILILWFFSGLYHFRLKVNFLNPLLVSLFSIPFIHLIFIKEAGPYSAMMMPFIYLGIVIGVNSIPVRKLSLIPGIIALYLFLFSLSSSFNNIASLRFLKPTLFETFFRSQVIINENVLADFPYYYFITGNGNRFISFYNTKKELTEDILNKNNIEFAVITKGNFDKNSDFFKNFGFNTISEYNSKKEEGLFYKVAIYLKKNIRSGYDGVVLKRKVALEPET